MNGLVAPLAPEALSYVRNALHPFNGQPRQAAETWALPGYVVYHMAHPVEPARPRWLEQLCNRLCRSLALQCIAIAR